MNREEMYEMLVRLNEMSYEQPELYNEYSTMLQHIYDTEPDLRDDTSQKQKVKRR